MTERFLRGVELSNFRIYGDSYAFELPDEPGITLITGANGLGKTSFFDGVEWALTGQVSRFSDIHVDGRRREADPLTRIGAPEGSHRVSLAFTNADPIDRGNGFVPDEQAIAALLKDPSWPGIGQLHGYLSITHFLGQASTRRFSLREPKAQWEALKGPAGVDRINSLRERVSGQGARRAFTRAIQQRTQTLEKARIAFESWGTLIAERDQLARLASSERSYAPSQVLDGVEQLARQLTALLPTAVWLPVRASDEPEATLNRLAGLIEQVTSRNAEDEKRCIDLEHIFSAFEEAGSKAAATSGLAKEISERRASLVEAVASAETKLTQAVAAHGRVEQAAAQVQSRAVALARVARATEQLAKAQADLGEIAGQLAKSRAASEQVEAQLHQGRAQLEELKERRAERGRVAYRLGQAEQRSRLSSQIALVRAELQRLSILAAAIDAAALRTERAALGEVLSRAGVELARIEGELRQHDDRARSLSDAVSLIAHQLQHDDQNCPICATSFQPGQLKALAMARASTDIAPASALARAMVETKASQETVLRRVGEIDRKIIEHDQIMATLATEQARERDLVRQLVEAEGSPDTLYDDSEVLALTAALKDIDVQLQDHPPEDDLNVLTAGALASLDAERVRRASLEQRRTTVSDDIEAARSLLSQHGDLWSPATGLLVPLDEAQSAIDRDGRSIGEQLSAAAAAVDEARIARDSLGESISREDANLAKASRDVEALAEQRRALVQQWTEAGQPGEPNGSWPAQLRSLTTERQQRVAQIADAHATLINGLRRWQTDQQLQERERALKAELDRRGLPSVAEVTAGFEAEMAAAQEALDLAQRARARMEEVGARMQDRADQFADDVLKPLNETIQRFARPLMTWTDASIIYRAEHHATRSELRPAILRAETDGSMTQLEMNPNLYFSEGQLAALSVSALLAASTTFRWSSWRGLLLDDPLQHNDVIHASAFMDLLRQMVRELRYQIILSTHDSAEAEFLVRKCRSAGIPYALHELVPQGDEGLVSAAA